MTDPLASEFFDVTVEGGVVSLVMNNPDKSNAMSASFWADLPRIARALDAMPEVRVVVISGNGKNFSGGMDLSVFNDLAALSKLEAGRAAYAMRKNILYYQDAFTALEEMRVPVIAAIQGACIGGAVDLISACDIRIASQDAYFCIEEVNIGMAADVGTLQRLPKLVPAGIVAELALTGRRFAASEALGFGMLSAVHADHEATLCAAREMAEGIASKSPLAVAGTKKSLVYARDHTVADGLDQIATWNGGIMRPEELMTAMQARMDKKAAVFKDIA